MFFLKQKEKNFLFLLAIIIIFLSLLQKNNIYADNETTYISTSTINYVENEVLIKYKNSDSEIKPTFVSNSLTNKLGLNYSLLSETESNIENLDNNISIIKITDGSSVKEKIEELNKNPNVEYAQPNFIYHPTADTIEDIGTNDQYISSLWNLASTSVPSAWKINEGTTSPVVVAVIDTGVDYTHQDISSNMWDGTNCYSYNGSLLGECIHGYDFYDNDKDPMPSPTYYHGTHVAGIISAIKNNGLGIVGIAPNAKIMAIRVGNDTFSTSNIIKAIKFAKNNGAKIINASLGITCPSNVDFLCHDYYFESIINSFPGLFIAAAGNDGRNSDANISHTYPSDFSLNNIISVASTNHSDELSSFSNYGTTSVDIGAPGSGIYSLITNNSYQLLSGTSMATPHIVGLAALIEGYNPNITTTQIKNIILSTGDSLNSLNNKILSGKRMNAYNAMLASIPKSIVSFNFPEIQSTSTINQDNYSITVDVPFNTDITKLIPTISITGLSIEPSSGISQNFTNPINYTVTATDNSKNYYTVTVRPEIDPNIQIINNDKNLLTENLIKGKNDNLLNIKYPLNLPMLGDNGSKITWVSSNPDIVSNDGLIINKNYDPNLLTITLTATLTRIYRQIISSNDYNEFTISDTKQFTVTTPYYKKISSGGGGGGSSIKKNIIPILSININTPIDIKNITPNNYSFNNTLSFGSSGPEVIELQNRLTSDGIYKGPITGYFGILTKEAVKNYQIKNNLPVVGIVGPLTIKSLNSSSNSNNSDSNNNSTIEIIKMFINLGIITPDKADTARKFFGL